MERCGQETIITLRGLSSLAVASTSLHKHTWILVARNQTSGEGVG